MKRILLAGYLFVALPSAAGCLPSGNQAAEYYLKTAVDVSNTAALAIEGSQGAAMGMYQADQELVLRMAQERGYDKDKVKAEIEEVRTRWKPMWEVFEKVRKAHDLVVEALKAGESASRVVPLMKNLSELQAEAANKLKSLKRLSVGRKANEYRRFVCAEYVPQVRRGEGASHRRGGLFSGEDLGRLQRDLRGGTPKGEQG